MPVPQGFKTPVVVGMEGTNIHDVWSMNQMWAEWRHGLYLVLEIYPLDQIPEAMF